MRCLILSHCFFFKEKYQGFSCAFCLPPDCARVLGLGAFCLGLAWRSLLVAVRGSGGETSPAPAALAKCPFQGEVVPLLFDLNNLGSLCSGWNGFSICTPPSQSIPKLFL